MNRRTVILADGKFPHHAHALQILRDAERVVCCDGATKKLLEWGRMPDAIVGDLDSLSAELKQRFADRIFQSDDQETNDLTKAVNWCIERGVKQVTILGATGLRDDHTLGNIALLVDYVSDIEVEMVTDTGVFTPVLCTKTFTSEVGQQISIFAITPDTPITTNGLKYDVTKRCFTSWWQGTLNQAEGNEFTIYFEQGKVIVYCTYPTITIEK